MNIKILTLITCLSGLFLTLLPAGSLAQGMQAIDPLSRIITVSHYKRDKNTGNDVLVDRWGWIDYAAYYRLSSLIQSTPLASSAPPAAEEDPNEKIVITETEANGDMLTYMSLKGGRNTMTTFAYNYNYYEDVTETGALFSARLAAEQTNPTPTPAPALMTFEKREGEKKMLWRTNDSKDADLIRAMLQKSPKITGVDQIRMTNDFSGKDRLILDMTLPNLPQQIVFDRFQIRTTEIVPTTRAYIDTVKMWTTALGQKVLKEKYKSMGIENPPKAY